MTVFDGQPLDSASAKLELGARAFRYDPLLEKWADLFSTDVEAWQKLSVLQQDRSGAYIDARAAYRRAVSAGAVADDRGPGSQKGATTW